MYAVKMLLTGRECAISTGVTWADYLGFELSAFLGYCLERGRAQFRLQLQGLTPEVSVRFTVAEQARESFPQSPPLTLVMHRQK